MGNKIYSTNEIFNVYSKETQSWIGGKPQSFVTMVAL